VRIIKPTRIRQYWQQHRRARKSLERWLAFTREAKWANLSDTRRTFPAADPVKVASGRTATVFNIAGNEYRLITAIHYNMGKVFVLRFLTHAECDKDKWKDEL